MTSRRPWRTTRPTWCSVKAGCGTGKTVAAYLRAAKRYVGRRLYFCYPTTGTATEGYRDYLFPDVPTAGAADTQEHAADRQRLEEVCADLFHSRSGIDFDIILGTGSDSKTADADAAASADALEAWADTGRRLHRRYGPRTHAKQQARLVCLASAGSVGVHLR